MRKPALFTAIKLLISLIVITAGCKKDFTTAIATIIDTGKTTEKCGFMVEIDGVKYHAENLDSQYQTDSLKVYVNVKLADGRYNCSTSAVTANTGVAIIHINQIEKVIK